MLTRENGRLVHERFMVILRRGDAMLVRQEAEQLDGKTFRFRYGWQLTSEHGGAYAGETAMVPVLYDPDFPYPLDAPPWIASGDLRRVDEMPAELALEPAA